MKIKKLTEALTTYFDDNSGIEYVSWDGVTFVPYNEMPGEGNHNPIKWDSRIDYNVLERENKARKDAGIVTSEDDIDKQLQDFNDLMTNEYKRSAMEADLKKRAHKFPKASTEVYRDYVKDNGGLEAFKYDLEKIVRKLEKQSKKKSRSFKEYNPEYDNDERLIVAGEYEEIISKKKFPHFLVYMDVSGSVFDFIPTTKRAISVLEKAKQKKLLDYDLLYFGSYVSTSIGNAGGGTNGDAVMRDIHDKRPDDVIILTDSDYSSCSVPHYTAPGTVMYLWARGWESEGFKEALHGEHGTYGYTVEKINGLEDEDE